MTYYITLGLLIWILALWVRHLLRSGVGLTNCSPRHYQLTGPDANARWADKCCQECGSRLRLATWILDNDSGRVAKGTASSCTNSNCMAYGAMKNWLPTEAPAEYDPRTHLYQCPVCKERKRSKEFVFNCRPDGSLVVIDGSGSICRSCSERL